MTLRVAVIGLGVGEQHVRAYRAHPGAEVTAVCDVDPDKLEAAARAYPGLRTTRDAAEVLEDPAIDAVSIASFDDVHHEHALAALRAGKHVFVEKPVCVTLDQARELKAALAEQPDLVLASNLVLRAAPLYRWLRDERRSGALGNLYAFDGDYLYGRLHKITEGWRKDVADYSVMLGGGVHLVDLMLWISGERPASVTAAGNRLSTEGSTFRYLDFVAAAFEFPSGLVGRITANFGAVLRHQHAMRVFGTRATVLYDDAGPRLHTSRDDPGRPLDLAPLPASKGDLIPGFVESILQGADRSAEAQHELDVIAVCLAADQALAEGATIDIDYV